MFEKELQSGVCNTNEQMINENRNRNNISVTGMAVLGNDLVKVLSGKEELER